MSTTRYSGHSCKTQSSDKWFQAVFITQLDLIWFLNRFLVMQTKSRFWHRPWFTEIVQFCWPKSWMIYITCYVSRPANRFIELLMLFSQRWTDICVSNICKYPGGRCRRTTDSFFWFYYHLQSLSVRHCIILWKDGLGTNMEHLSRITLFEPYWMACRLT